jgi:WD40 repeat protein
MNFVGHHDCVACVAFTNDGTKIVSSSHDNLIIIWDVVSGTVKTKMIGHTGTVFKVEYTPDNKFIISCSFDRSVKVSF